jgi:hypothetical protein
MKYILYFSSRKNFGDKSTWSKEAYPSDASIPEVRRAAMLAGCEGFAIVNFKTKKTHHFEWFVNA